MSYLIGHVFGDVCRWILYLRQRHGAVTPVMWCRIDAKDALHHIMVGPLHASKNGHVLGEYAVVDLFLQFGWRSSPGYWDLVAWSLEHAHNQTSSEDPMVSELGRSYVEHVSADADAGLETIPILPDCERVPDSRVTGGAPDVGWETIRIPSDRTHIPDSGVAAGASGVDRETLPIPSDAERAPGTGGDTGDPFFVRLYVDDSILVKERFFQDERRLRCVIESLASDHL